MEFKILEGNRILFMWPSFYKDEQYTALYTAQGDEPISRVIEWINMKEDRNRESCQKK